MARMPILPDRAPIPVPVMGRGGPAAVSFTAPAALADPTGGMTLDALMLRQRQLAEQQAQQGQPTQQNNTIYGGLGTMLDRFMTGRAEQTARAQESAGREQLAQTLAGVDPSTGVNQQQIGEVSKLDPDLALKLYDQALEARKAAAAEATRLAERKEDQGIAVANREDIQEGARQSAATKHVTGDEAKKMGLDPTRTWEINLQSGQSKDITPDVPEQWSEPFPDPNNPNKQLQKNLKTNETKAVGGGGITISNLPAEVGARIGLGDEFLTKFEDIKKGAVAGDNTGPYDYFTSAVMGRGEAGTHYRAIQSGLDALRRGLTGAGMGEKEANEYANRYLPTLRDDANSLVSKLDGLKGDLEAVRRGATVGRNAPPAPDTGDGSTTTIELPEGVTEDDIAETMRANNMTREQVLNALKAQGG